MHPGDLPEAAFYVRSGVVKAYSINGSGDVQIVSFILAKGIFPLSWTFGISKATMFYYEALCDSELWLVPKTRLVQIISENEQLQSSLQRYLLTGYTGMLLRVRALEQSRALDKIALTLEFLIFHRGRETSPGIYEIPIKLTHGVIASLVGLSRETTAQTLATLKRRGIISYQSSIYSINKAMLERLVGDDTTSSLVR